MWPQVANSLEPRGTNKKKNINNSSFQTLVRIFFTLNIYIYTSATLCVVTITTDRALFIEEPGSRINLLTWHLHSSPIPSHRHRIQFRPESVPLHGAVASPSDIAIGCLSDRLHVLALDVTFAQ